MKLDRPEVRAEFTGRPFCEWCKRPAFGGTDCAHVFSRGAGWVDIFPNLVALCRECHSRQGNGGSPTPMMLLELAARREGMTAEEVREEVYRIRRLDKSGQEIKRRGT